MHLEMELKTAQTITPQMITTMTILQYGVQELEEYLSELSYENPMVELQAPVQAPLPNFTDQLRWLRQSDRQNRSYYTQDADDALMNVAAPDETASLTAFLTEQLLTMELSHGVRRAMETLIELLDSHGFFTTALAEVAALSGSSRGDTQTAFSLLRQLDPAGVGARNVQESLLLQLQRTASPDPLAMGLVKECYGHLAAWSEERLASYFKVSPQEIAAAKAKIAALSPYPAHGFSSKEAICYVRPDLYIFPEGGTLAVQAGDETLPTLSVNPQYLSMLETEKDPAVQQYLKEKLQQLQQVAHNLGNRKTTMLRCGEVIARRQRDFFYGGSLQKMTLRDVAEEMEVHESTVSRTIRNKYIQCPQGIFSMSSFFGRSAGQNTSLSRRNIQSVLAGLIAQEDQRRPLSDEKLVAQLAQQNILLSRRTVAKYRMELGIFPASSRRRP